MRYQTGEKVKQNDKVKWEEDIFLTLAKKDNKILIFNDCLFKLVSPDNLILISSDDNNGLIKKIENFDTIFYDTYFLIEVEKSLKSSGYIICKYRDFLASLIQDDVDLLFYLLKNKYIIPREIKDKILSIFMKNKEDLLKKAKIADSPFFDGQNIKTDIFKELFPNEHFLFSMSGNKLVVRGRIDEKLFKLKFVPDDIKWIQYCQIINPIPDVRE